MEDSKKTSTDDAVICPECQHGKHFNKAGEFCPDCSYKSDSDGNPLEVKLVTKREHEAFIKGRGEAVRITRKRSGAKPQKSVSDWVREAEERTEKKYDGKISKLEAMIENLSQVKTQEVPAKPKSPKTKKTSVGSGNLNPEGANDARRS